MRNHILVALAITSLFFSFTSAQDATPPSDAAALKDEVATLKETIETLKTTLALVEIERDALRLRLARLDKVASDSDRDLFEVGVTWQGSRFMTVPNAPKRQAGRNLRLVITERDGPRFKGQIHFVARGDRPQVLEVSGSAPETANGRVVFKTTAIGVFQQSYEGVLKGNQISLTFEGTDIRGKRGVGTANLTR